MHHVFTRLSALALLPCLVLDFSFAAVLSKNPDARTTFCARFSDQALADSVIHGTTFLGLEPTPKVKALALETSGLRSWHLRLAAILENPRAGDDESAKIQYKKLIWDILAAVPGTLRQRALVDSVMTFMHSEDAGVRYRNVPIPLAPTAHTVLVSMAIFLLATTRCLPSDLTPLDETIHLYNRHAQNSLMPLNRASLFAEALVPVFYDHDDFEWFTVQGAKLPGDAGIVMQALYGLLNVIHLEIVGELQLTDTRNLWIAAKKLFAYLDPHTQSRARNPAVISKAEIGLLRILTYIMPRLLEIQMISPELGVIVGVKDVRIAKETCRNFEVLILRHIEFIEALAHRLIAENNHRDPIWAGWASGANDYEFLTRRLLNREVQERLKRTYFDTGIYAYRGQDQNPLIPEEFIPLILLKKRENHELQLDDERLVDIMRGQTGPLHVHFNAPLDTLLMNPKSIDGKSLRDLLTSIGYYSWEAAQESIHRFWAALDRWKTMTRFNELYGYGSDYRQPYHLLNDHPVRAAV